MTAEILVAEIAQKEPLKQRNKILRFLHCCFGRAVRNVQGNPRRELLPKTRALSAAHLEQIPANKRVLCSPLAAPHPKSGTKSPI